MQETVGFAQVEVRAGVFGVTRVLLLKEVNCLLVLTISLILIIKRRIAHTQPQMGLGVIRIALNGLFEGLGRLLVLIVSVQVLALFHEGLRLTPGLFRVAGQRRVLGVVTVGIERAITPAAAKRNRNQDTEAGDTKGLGKFRGRHSHKNRIYLL